MTHLVLRFKRRGGWDGEKEVGTKEEEGRWEEREAEKDWGRHANRCWALEQAKAFIYKRLHSGNGTAKHSLSSHN